MHYFRMPRHVYVREQWVCPSPFVGQQCSCIRIIVPKLDPNQYDSDQPPNQKDNLHSQYPLHGEYPNEQFGINLDDPYGGARNRAFARVVCGTRDGLVMVFDIGHDTPIAQAQLEGTITVIVSGDLTNSGEDSVCIITNQGQCSLFSIGSLLVIPGYSIGLATSSETTEKSKGTASQRGMDRFSGNITAPPDLNSDFNVDQIPEIKPYFTQSIQSNVASAFVGDLDGDGLIALVVGLTDRVIRLYRFHGQMAKGTTMSQKTLGGGSAAAAAARHAVIGGKISKPHFHAVSKWEFPGFIMGLSLFEENAGCTILISQVQWRYLSLDLTATQPDCSPEKDSVRLILIKDKSLTQSNSPLNRQPTLSSISPPPTDPVPGSSESVAYSTSECDPIVIHVESVAFANFHAVTDRLLLVDGGGQPPDLPLFRTDDAEKLQRDRQVMVELPSMIFRGHIVSWLTPGDEIDHILVTKRLFICADWYGDILFVPIDRHSLEEQGWVARNASITRASFGEPICDFHAALLQDRIYLIGVTMDQTMVCGWVTVESIR